MLEVFDRQRNLIGILENAYGLSEELKINSVNYFKFSLPFNDFKNELCQPFHYIRYKKGQLYRILPSQITVNELGDIQYSCEHVLALLIDKVMFGEHVVGNRGYFTRNVIEYVLKHQIEKNWVLGDCDFNRQFEYEWTSESLLSALFSITRPFVEKYIWTFDTSRFPYVISLKKIDENARTQMYIRRQKNALQISKISDTSNICTRLYPLGEGEGINQLDIKNLTGGVAYIQSPQTYIDKYGIVERVWIDRRYKQEESLYNAAVSMLTELQEPFEEYQVEFATLGTDSFDVPELGKIVEVVGFKKTYITAINFNYDEIETSTITIANKPKEIATTIADMQDRQRIEMAYSQGATQFYQDHVYDNATPTVGLPLKLMLPSSMKIVNKINIDVEVGPFRKPFTVTGGGGGTTIAQSNTTSSGASTTTSTASGGGQTSESSSITTTLGGGGVSTSTENGGTTTSETSSITSTDTHIGELSNIKPDSEAAEGQTHNHGIPYQTYLLKGAELVGDTTDGYELKTYTETWYPSGAHTHGDHDHSIGHTHTIDSHSHDFSIDEHQHDMEHTHNISSHTHNMSHNHDISHTHTIGDHVHYLDPGISFSGNPTSFDLLINGVKVETVSGNSLQKDITQFLVGNENRIPRDIYHKIEIVPNDTAYVMLTVSIQGFIQSRGDMTV